VGEIVSEPATLSNPRLESSAGRNFAGSISSASKSRIAFAYSVRLRRCSTLVPGAAGAARSISVSSQDVSAA
jgi:hypothetical protein